jgi:hypothetical protein
VYVSTVDDDELGYNDSEDDDNDDDGDGDGKTIDGIEMND